MEMKCARGHSGESNGESNDEIDRLYRSLTNVLGGTLTRRYGLSGAEAQGLVNDALAAYLALTTKPLAAEAWLVWVVCMEAERLHQSRTGGAAAPDTAAEIARARDLLALGEALDALPPDMREAVRMHAREKRSYEEIAAELKISVDEAKRLVSTALVALRKRRT